MGRTEGHRRRAACGRVRPLNDNAHHDLGWTLYYGRQNREAIAAYQDTLALNPDDSETYALRGLAYYALGDLRMPARRVKPSPTIRKANNASRSPMTARRMPMLKQCLRRSEQSGAIAGLICTPRSRRSGQRTESARMARHRDALAHPALEFLKTDPLLDPLRKSRASRRSSGNWPFRSELTYGSDTVTRRRTRSFDCPLSGKLSNRFRRLLLADRRRSTRTGSASTSAAGPSRCCEGRGCAVYLRT